MNLFLRWVIPLTKTMYANVSKSGVSLTKKAGPVTVNTKGRARVRLAKGVSIGFKLWR